MTKGHQDRMPNFAYRLMSAVIARKELFFRSIDKRALKRGAVSGLVAGLAALAGVFAAAVHCLPFQISFPPPPWPWYCSHPAYGILGYLAFPVNLLTNDLSQAIRFAPLSLLIYVILGAFIGSGLDRFRSSSPGG